MINLPEPRTSVRMQRDELGKATYPMLRACKGEEDQGSFRGVPRPPNEGAPLPDDNVERSPFNYLVPKTKREAVSTAAHDFEEGIRRKVRRPKRLGKTHHSEVERRGASRGRSLTVRKKGTRRDGSLAQNRAQARNNAHRGGVAQVRRTLVKGVQRACKGFLGLPW